MNINIDFVSRPYRVLCVFHIGNTIHLSFGKSCSEILSSFRDKGLRDLYCLGVIDLS